MWSFVPDIRGRSTTDGLIAGVAAGQGEMFARWQCDVLDIPVRALEYRSETERLFPTPYRGVFAVGTPVLTQLSHAWGAVLECGEGSVLGAYSASGIWRMLTVARAKHDVFHAAKRIESARVLPRRVSLLEEEWTFHPETRLPLTTPARTATDLAALGNRRHVEIALQQGEYERLDFTGIERYLNHRPGAPILRAVLGDRAAGSRTLTRTGREEIYLAITRAAGLPDPKTGWIIGPYEADFCWPELRLVVEIDGGSHDTLAARRRDPRKHNVLQALGYRIVRFTDEEILGHVAYVTHTTVAAWRDLSRRAA